MTVVVQLVKITFNGLVDSSPGPEIARTILLQIYPGFALIGQALTLLRSHWSRVSLVMFGPVMGVFYIGGFGCPSWFFMA